MNAQADIVFPIFFGVWILLGIFSAAFFFFNNDAALKRKVYPPFVVGVGILFLVFGALTGFAKHPFIYVLVPMVGLITFLNLRSTKFCDSCGKTLFNQSPFAPAKFCSRCGANLEG